MDVTTNFFNDDLSQEGRDYVSKFLTSIGLEVEKVENNRWEVIDKNNKFDISNGATESDVSKFQSIASYYVDEIKRIFGEANTTWDFSVNTDGYIIAEINIPDFVILRALRTPIWKPSKALRDKYFNESINHRQNFMNAMNESFKAKGLDNRRACRESVKQSLQELKIHDSRFINKTPGQAYKLIESLNANEDTVDEGLLGTVGGKLAGGAIGTALGGPVGGMVGSFIGGKAGDALSDLNESNLTEGFESDVYNWLENHYGTTDWKSKFKQYVNKIKKSGYNTSNLDKELNSAIKKISKKTKVKPQVFISALNESRGMDPDDRPSYIGKQAENVANALINTDAVSTYDKHKKPSDDRNMQTLYDRLADVGEMSKKHNQRLNKIKSKKLTEAVEQPYFKAFITNLSEYNDGKLVGDWVDFPIDEDDFENVLRKIGISPQYEEWFVTDFDCNLNGFDWQQLGEYPSYDTLQEFGNLIDSISDVEAVDNAYEVTGDLQEAIEGLDDGIIYYYPGINSEEALGMMIVEEVYGGVENLPSDMIEYCFDYAALGRDLGFDDYWDNLDEDQQEELLADGHEDYYSAAEFFCGNENASDQEVGETYVEEMGGISNVYDPEQYFDYEEFGQYLKSVGDYTFTSDGVIEYK